MASVGADVQRRQLSLVLAGGASFDCNSTRIAFAVADATSYSLSIAVGPGAVAVATYVSGVGATAAVIRAGLIAAVNALANTSGHSVSDPGGAALYFDIAPTDRIKPAGALAIVAVSNVEITQELVFVSGRYEGFTAGWVLGTVVQERKEVLMQNLSATIALHYNYDAAATTRCGRVPAGGWVILSEPAPRNAMQFYAAAAMTAALDVG